MESKLYKIFVEIDITKKEFLVMVLNMLKDKKIFLSFRFACSYIVLKGLYLKPACFTDKEMNDFVASFENKRIIKRIFFSESYNLCNTKTYNLH